MKRKNAESHIKKRDEKEHKKIMPNLILKKETKTNMKKHAESYI